MGYASPQGHMLYPSNRLRQPSIGFNPQHGYMPYPEKREPTSFVGFNQDTRFQQTAQSDTTWGQAPLQQAWNMPAHHHAEQFNPTAPVFHGVKMEPALNQSMQFPPRVEQSFPMVPQCSRVKASEPRLLHTGADRNREEVSPAFGSNNIETD